MLRTSCPCRRHPPTVVAGSGSNVPPFLVWYGTLSAWPWCRTRLPHRRQCAGSSHPSAGLDSCPPWPGAHPAVGQAQQLVLLYLRAPYDSLRQAPRLWRELDWIVRASRNMRLHSAATNSLSSRETVDSSLWPRRRYTALIKKGMPGSCSGCGGQTSQICVITNAGQPLGGARSYRGTAPHLEYPRYPGGGWGLLAQW